MENNNRGLIIGLVVVLVLAGFYLFLRFQSNSGQSAGENLVGTDAEMILDNEASDESVLSDDIIGDVVANEIIMNESAEEAPNYMQPQPPVALSDVQSEQMAFAASDREPAEVTFNISGGSFYYVPNMIRVKEGDRVRIVFSNMGGTHDLVLPDFDVRTGVTSTGESDTIEFVADKTGSFEFYCSVGGGYHREMGQIGTLLVE